MLKRTCSVDGCGKPHVARGFCSAHYQRHRKTGDAGPAEVLERILNDTPRRFWAKVDAGGVCWEWQGNKFGDGYGQFTVGVRRIPAHRWSYEHLVGPIPDGLVLDHLCRNALCVSPDHLEPVTHLENVRRGTAGMRRRMQTHCKNGHLFDESNTYIRPDTGSRGCRSCNSAAQSRYQERREQRWP